MDIARKLLSLFFIAVLGLSAVACNAEGEVDEGGAGLEVEGEGGEGGEGGDD